MLYMPAEGVSTGNQPAGFDEKRVAIGTCPAISVTNEACLEGCQA